MLKYNIIPKPASYQTAEGTYTVSTATAVLCAEEFTSAGSYLSAYLQTKPQEGEGAIKFKKVAGMEPEAYTLTVNANGIVVEASEAAGAFYGAVTLKMILMQAQKRNGKAIVNALKISDKPVYGYRGFMLDVSRHFFEKDVILRLLDTMALLKLNVFHWHLCDDQGYRIESKLFPKLNEIGSTRKHAHLKSGAPINLENDGVEYSGYYTHEEIKEVVAYAKKLHIHVLPEIDLPGHTTAILASYPEYGCTGKEYEVCCQNGVLDAIMCAGSEEAYDFIDKLLGEITPLFDYKYFHIGGDEAKGGYGNWHDCEKCKAVKEREGLKDEKQLQVYYMGRIYELLKKYNKLPIAWNDCLNDDLDEDIVCHFWVRNGLGTLKKQAYKRDVILSPQAYFYFDKRYATIPLKKTYNFRERKVGFGKAGQRAIGIECEHWTEWIDSEDVLNFSAFPRAVAMAEVAWTKSADRNFRDFKKRLEFFKLYMDKKNINYSRIEKKSRGTKSLTVFHLGADGKEYQKNEEIKAKK